MRRRFEAVIIAVTAAQIKRARGRLPSGRAARREQAAQRMAA